MIKFYQDSWFDIKFADICSTDRFNVADEQFYNHFYAEFFKKYRGYQELPQYYRDTKDDVVEKISENKISDKILSIGSGNGYIEAQLIDVFENIIAVEPSQLASQWLLQNPKVDCYSGFFPVALPVKLKGQVTQAYSVALDYVFNQQQYTEFLRSIVDFGINDYTMYQATLYSKRSAPLAYLRMLLIKLGVYRKSEFQLWGVMRTAKESIDCFKAAGFTSVDVGYFENGNPWIRGKIGK